MSKQFVSGDDVDAKESRINGQFVSAEDVDVAGNYNAENAAGSMSCPCR